MIKKSLTLMATLAIAGTLFAQGPNVDVEKADRFRAVESEAAAEDTESDTGAAEEASLAPQAGEGNPFVQSTGVDSLEMLGGNAQLEDLGYTSRRCYWTSFGWICF